MCKATHEHGMIDRSTEDEEELAEESEETEDSSDGSVLDDGAETDNVGDPSVEINVEELISEFEAQNLTNRLNKDASTRKRLEELMEHKRARRELEDFDDYDI